MQLLKVKDISSKQFSTAMATKHNPKWIIVIQATKIITGKPKMAHQYADHYNIIFQAYENMMTTKHKKAMQMT